ncbi:hypothetical protein PtrSN001C_004643 [Pyrenophora tritici-repentis]|nr:hypothetical protein PtrSN001C_004643 [Pyrenophora tritici-repentis]
MRFIFAIIVLATSMLGGTQADCNSNRCTACAAQCKTSDCDKGCAKAYGCGEGCDTGVGHRVRGFQA